MAKNNNKPNVETAESTLQAKSNTLKALKENSELCYKVKVLLYDLRNISTDHASEMRTLSTVDELYINIPYFTSSKTMQIKTATLENSSLTVEEAIKEKLVGFFDKRKASGDSRPCGPHDMAPIYESVFEINQNELKEERFSSRLRRSGLGNMPEREVPATSKKKNGKKVG